MILVSIILSGCSSGPKIVIRQPGSTYHAVETGKFRAGAAEVDITPPPGLPLWGFPLVTPYSEGYWTRLKARIIVFEDGRGHRVAQVQLDWGAVSSLLHRKVAGLSAPLGFEPANLMIAATHTHAAPGGTFGAANYNKFGGRSGFYPQLVDWLAGHIAAGVKEAIMDLAPAGIAAGRIRVTNLSRNRSIPASESNFNENKPDIYAGNIIPDIHVLRVDHLHKKDNGGHQPIAAFVIAPLHATAVGQKNKLYHGDLHSAAARYLAAGIESRYKLNRRFVAAVAAGPQGDVSPTWLLEEGQSIDEAKRLGRLLAGKADEMFERLDVTTINNNDIRLQYAYNETFLPGAPVAEGKSLCFTPEMGKAAAGGAEDGRSSFYGKFGIREGNAHKTPKGCHGHKITLPKFITHIAVNPKFWPKTAPVQVIRLGNVLTLAAIPGEPTTETGRLIDEALAQHTDTQTAVVALANNYMAYIATAEEYKAQHFEGGMTYWGPHEAEFFTAKVRQTAAHLEAGTAKYAKQRTFLAGRPTYPYNRKGKTGYPAKWKSLVTVERLRVKPGRETDTAYRFHWRGLKRQYLPVTLPTISIECNGSLLIGPGGMAETDHGLNIVVKRKKKNLWSAVWTPPEGIPTDAKYRFMVSRPGMKPLYSEEFQPQ